MCLDFCIDAISVTRGEGVDSQLLVEAVVVRRKELVNVGRVAYMLAEADFEQDALAFLEKRIPQCILRLLLFGIHSKGAPGLGALSMSDYIGLHSRHVDSTDTGGSSYLIHVVHAA